MKVSFSVYRYHPEVDQKPYMQDFMIEIPDGSDIMLLDALMKIKEQDPTFSFRRSCREGICGSDGMNINGKNGLACITHISSFKGKKIVIQSFARYASYS